MQVGKHNSAMESGKCTCTGIKSFDIALDKCPVHPWPDDVGETLRRIVGKVVCMVTHVDIEDLCGVGPGLLCLHNYVTFML